MLCEKITAPLQRLLLQIKKKHYVQKLFGSFSPINLDSKSSQSERT